MSDLNEIYGAALALPSEVSGILISGTPAPHEGANGIYLETGDSLGGRPVYSNDQGYYISAPEGGNYALYDTVDPPPNGGYELYSLGPDGVGPVSAGQLAEPFPSVQAAGSNSFGILGGLIQGPSTANALSQYPAASTLPPSPVNPLAVPAASSLPTSPENPVSTPAATVLPASSLHPVSNFSSALQPPGFPSYLIEPPSPAMSIRTNHSAVVATIVTVSGARYRVRNHRTGNVSAFTNSGTLLTVALLPGDWNLLTFETEGDAHNDVKNLDMNHTGTRISGSFVLHAARHFPRYGTFTGATWLAVNLLDLQIPDSVTYLNYWNIARTNLNAGLIDRLLIVADTATNPTGTLAYSNNPGAADGLRSVAALAAMNSLLQKGWTITR